MAIVRICAVADCDKQVWGKGFCRNHHHRFKKYGDPVGGPTANGEPLKWIHDHVHHVGDGCLIWPFARRDKNYGRFNDATTGKQKYAHQEMCELAHGKKPSPEHEVAHSCGKGHEGCIHPKHLRWDTPLGNAADRIEHGTENRGQRNGSAKLTDDDVRAIRNEANNRSQREIAALFGICQQTVSDIVRRRRWAWLI